MARSAWAAGAGRKPCPGGTGCPGGKTSRAVSPPPSSRGVMLRPDSCAAAIAATIDRPSPSPSSPPVRDLVRAGPAGPPRWNGSSSLPTSSVPISGPVLPTVSTALPEEYSK